MRFLSLSKSCWSIQEHDAFMQSKDLMFDYDNVTSAMNDWTEVANQRYPRLLVDRLPVLIFDFLSPPPSSTKQTIGVACHTRTI
jgi:hypothetical protein